MSLETVNPHTGKLIKSFDEYSSEQVKEIIDKSQLSFYKWKETDFALRKKLMLNVANILRKDKRKYSELMTIEMGKPITQAEAEVEKCACVCEYYADNAEAILSKEIIDTDASESFVRFDPLGVILAVMPWNFPFWQVFRFAAPAIMAGNIGLLKHASNVPQCALAIQEVFQKADFPEYTFSTLLIGSSNVNEVISNNIVKAVTLTGSDYAGRKVAEQCGKMLKKSVMELGGSDPFIVLKDADIDLAVSTAVTARLINNGQSCIAAKRFIVEEVIYDKFTQKFVAKMEKTKIGDPMNKDTELGPLARKDLLLELDEQVKRSVKLGARILTGCYQLEREGYYYAPSIIANVTKGMPAYDEELFGPIASLILAKDENDAIRIANDTLFGLGSSLWTKDRAKAKKLAEKIEAGSVFINGLVKSDPRLPFGGIKLSGYGRELSHYGIKEFVNIKTVWVK
ncbi:MAG: NAD-dependent succinate-semialdehyde dehydrogenase [Ignavibacteriales bacterium]|nr:NAD-dependent succinate-semialdehyde dehydrogenase [Ignavibacteriales bacterium]